MFFSSIHRPLNRIRSIFMFFLLSTILFAQSTGLRIHDQNNNIIISYGDDIVARYAFMDHQFKPYVKDFYSPRGSNILLDAPADHLHHHGLMMAFKVNGINFWEEVENPGTEKHIMMQHDKSGLGNELYAHIIDSLHWIHPQDQSILLKERRSIRIKKDITKKYNSLTWTSTFYPAAEQVLISGSHYHGLGLRFPESINIIGSFVNADNKPGAIFRGRERLTESRWCAYTVEPEGRPLTIAAFDSPDNPRPATWFTMKEPFAYLSATLNLHLDPIELGKSDTFKLTYAIIVWYQIKTTDQIEEAYATWIQQISDEKRLE